MANLTVRSRRDGAGHAVHPVARVKVTLPPRADDPDFGAVMRFTLRSDGKVLRQVFIPSDPVWGGRAKWTRANIWTTVRMGFPCCGSQREMGERLAGGLYARYHAIRPDCIVEVEEV